MKKISLAVLGLLSLAAAGWWWMSPKQVCMDCLPLPDMTEWMLPSAPALSLPYPKPPSPEAWRQLAPDARLKEVRRRVQPLLEEELKKRGLVPGSQVYLRAFKESHELELWLKASGEWQLWRSYPIAAQSGVLGPKLAEGDGQVPEGFYSISAASLNPGSNYHLAMNIGYPNAWDREHQRTGSFIMIHGRDVSVGCLAMSDPVIEEIYLLVEAALSGGQPEVAVHVFPFRMTEPRWQQKEQHTHADFWREIEPVYRAFEASRIPPQVHVMQGRYVLE